MRGDDLRRGRPGPHPAQGHRCRCKARAGPCLGRRRRPVHCLRAGDVCGARPRHLRDGRSQPSTPERHRRHRQLGPPRFPHIRPREAWHIHRSRRRRQLRQVGDRSRPLCKKSRRRRFTGAMRRDRRPPSCPRGGRRHTRACACDAGRSRRRHKARPHGRRRHHPVRQHPAWGCRTSRRPLPSTSARSRPAPARAFPSTERRQTG